MLYVHRNFPGIDYCPHCYNARGPDYIKERAKAKTDPAVLNEYGGGDEYPLYFGDFADNGNYLETDEIAKRHGVCGDPEQVPEIVVRSSQPKRWLLRKL